MQKVGESRIERLDVIPAQFRVLVTVRPKYVCRPCNGAQHAQGETLFAIGSGSRQWPPPVQALCRRSSEPEWLVPRGLPTEALVAHSMVAKFGDYLPFHRQSEIWRRQG